MEPDWPRGFDRQRLEVSVQSQSLVWSRRRKDAHWRLLSLYNDSDDKFVK